MGIESMMITNSLGKPMVYHRGWVYCPVCGKNPKRRHGGKLLRVRIDTRAENLPIYCSYCRREYIIEIKAEPEAGQ